MTKRVDMELLEKFVIEVLEENISDEEVYGYISRFSKDDPNWCVFLIYDGSEGEKYCGGHYCLDDKYMEYLEDIISVFSSLESKVVVDTEGYFLMG